MASRPRREPLRKPPVEVPRPPSRSRSVAVNSPVPPTLNVAEPPLLTVRLVAVHAAGVAL